MPQLITTSTWVGHGATRGDEKRREKKRKSRLEPNIFASAFLLHVREIEGDSVGQRLKVVTRHAGFGQSGRLILSTFFRMRAINSNETSWVIVVVVVVVVLLILLLFPR